MIIIPENINSHAEELKLLYQQCDEEKKASIMRCLERLLQDTGNDKISKVSLQLDSVDIITSLPNREALTLDIHSLKNEAMLIILHINHLKIIQELHGLNYVKNILQEKAKQLKDVIDEDEVTLYSLNLHEFAILIPNGINFEKYFSIL